MMMKQMVGNENRKQMVVVVVWKVWMVVRDAAGKATQRDVAAIPAKSVSRAAILTKRRCRSCRAEMEARPDV